jgi:PKD repeat protein
MRTRLLRLAGVTFIALSAACGVHQTEAPALSGPSTLSTSVAVTATPDRITQDGASQSSVVVTVHGPTGQPSVGTSVRLDMMVGGTLVDYGTLSARTVVTGPDGTAKSIYTAPAAPPPPASATLGSVQIQAAALGSDATTTTPVTASIALVPPGVILPPADSPTPQFIINPSSPTTNVATLFDASSSCPGAANSQGVCQATSSLISTFAWTFGDGGVGSGQTTSHVYTTPATYNVTLTVTNSRGVSSSTSKSITIGASTGPTAAFVFSPTQPAAGQSVVFNAATSAAASGHTIASYGWNYGDGGTATGQLATHTFAVAGGYNVTLTVTDDVGQKTTTSQPVTVSSGGGGSSGATSASFISSPTTPSAGQVVFFNAAASSAATGKTLTNYSWNFGDGTVTNATISSISHAFAAGGTFTVTLTVTDSGGTTATTTSSVTVSAAGSGALTAAFSISPTDPTSGQLVTFNANTSSPQASIKTYDWDFGDGTIVTGQTTSVINHTYFTVTGNNYNIRLTVHDNTGQTATTVDPLAVLASSDPTANFTVTPNPTTVGATVTLDSSSSSAGVGPTYTWNFGDGQPVVTTASTMQTHSYSATGSYVITLTVTRASDGHTASTTRTLLVQ